MAFVAVDDRMVFFRVVRMMYVPGNRCGPTLEQINAVNRQWPCLRFFLDEDGYLNAGYEFSLKCQHIGEIAFDVLALAMNIIDEVYPVFMKEIRS